MGVVDVRSPVLPEVEQIVQLAREGLKFLPADRIALNPACGFAPEAGESPTLDEAYERTPSLGHGRSPPSRPNCVHSATGLKPPTLAPEAAGRIA